MRPGAAILNALDATSLEVAGGIRESFSGWMIAGAITFVCIVVFAGARAWLNSVNVGGR